MCFLLTLDKLNYGNLLVVDYKCGAELFKGWPRCRLGATLIT